MPKDTLAANAQTMPMNRRAVLSAITASAVLAAPRVAKAADLDAELLALQPEIDAAEREFEAALKVLSPAQERFYEIRDRLRADKPSPPADPEWDRILANLAAQMAEYRKRVPRPEVVAYEEAKKAFELAEEKARVESGLADAERLEEETSNVTCELKDRILAISARTLAGVIFKAKYAAYRDYDPDIVESIVDDLIAMSGEA